MAKAVFIASSHSLYRDLPGQHYHFPNSYLSRVERTVGDWVIFYEGRRGGSRGYYAVQKVDRIEPDPSDATHSYAILDRASELSFESEVARTRADGTPYETGLPPSRGSNTSSVRIISEADFAAIIEQGLQAELSPDTLPRTGAIDGANGFSEFAASFAGYSDTSEMARDRVLTSRAFREASFARQVKRAYRARCAMSGLELRNGGGRPEVQAAHILPVEENGPDTVRNGMALSGTVHWLFDRGLIGVDRDYSILVAKDSIANEVADRLLLPSRRLVLPADVNMQPHQGYLEWHLKERFKG